MAFFMNLCEENISKIESFLQKRWILICLIIVSFAVLWQLFLVQGVNFFWEDFTLYGLVEAQDPADTFLQSVGVKYSSINQNQSFNESAVRDIVKNYFTEVGATLVIQSHNVNLMPTYGFIGGLCKTKLFCYRVMSLFLIGYLIFVMLLFFKILEKLTFGIFAVIFYLTYFQLWQLTVYASIIPTLLMHSATVSSIFLFYFCYQKANSKVKVFMYIVIILLVTRFSILLKEEGRLLLFIIVGYLMITNFKNLCFKKNIILILLLFLTTFPFYGGITSFIRSEQGAGLSKFIFIIKESARLFDYLTFLHGSILLGMVIVSVFVMSFYLIKVKLLADNVEKKRSISQNLDLAVLAFIWFLGALMMPLFDKGLEYTTLKGAWFQVDFFYSLFPFVLFCFLSLSFILEVIPGKFKKVISLVIFISLLFSLGFHLVELNRLVGSYRDYFIGFDTVRDYIDNNNDVDSVLILPFDGQTAQTMFLTNNYVTFLSLTDMTNITLLERIKGNKTALYVTNSYPLEFSSSESIEQVAVVSPMFNSYYARLKYLFGRESDKKLYIYKLMD